MSPTFERIVLADCILRPSSTPHRVCFSKEEYFEDYLDFRGDTKRVLRIVVEDVTEQLKAQAEADLEAAYAGL